MKKKLFFILFLSTQFYAQDLTQGLLLDYSFDNNLNDSSGNGYDASNFGATFVEDRNSNANSAIYFDGINDYINFPNIDVLKPDLPLSFAFWIRYDSNSPNDRDVFNTSFEDNRNTGVFFNSQQSTGNYAINYGDGSNSYLGSTRRTYVTNSSIETGVWHHIIIIVNSSSNMRIYVDCSDFGGSYSGTGGDLQYSNLPGTIGRHDRNLSAPANYFNGAIDDFRYWDRALTDDEVAILQGASSYNISNINHPNSCNTQSGSFTISDLTPNNSYSLTYDYESSSVTMSLVADSNGEFSINNLSSGIYSNIVVTDNTTGCSDDLGQVEIQPSANFTPVLNSTPASVCGARDGSIEISGLITNTTYTISYTYESSFFTGDYLSDGNGTIEVSGFGSDIISDITISNASINCNENLGNITMVFPDFMTQYTVTHLTTCNASNGTITISELNPGGSYVVDYFLNGNQVISNYIADVNGEILLNGLSSGIYQFIMVIDNNEGCSDGIGELEISSLGFSPILAFEPPTACGVDDGTMTFSGLTSGQQYNIVYNYESILEATTEIADTNGEILITNLPNGLYTAISITENSSGCVNDLDDVDLMSPPLMAEVTSTVPSACGMDDGTITISVLNYNSNYSIAFNFEGSPVSVNATSDDTGVIVINQRANGIYTDINVTELSSGCTDNLGDLDLFSDPLMAVATIISPTVCGVNDGSIVISNLNPTSDYTVIFDFDGNIFNATFTSDIQGQIELTELESGSYNDLNVTENNSGCTDNLGQLELFSGALLASINHNNLSSCLESDGLISINNLNPNSDYIITYEYQAMPVLLTRSSDSSGGIDISNLDVGIYDNIVITENATGCSASLGQLELFCTTEGSKCFETMAYFTPNNDAIHDLWEVKPIGSSCNYILYIYNRYGKLLKTLTPNNNKWDGTFNGYPMPQDDYWYKIDYNDGVNNLTYTSHFTLRR